MNANVWPWVMLCLLAHAACFHDSTSLRGSLGLPRVVSVTVRDTAGTPWPTEAVPRRIQVELRFEATPTERRSPWPIYLVRGLADDDFLADLAHPPLRDATASRLLDSSQVLGADAQLVVTPLESLLPGASYTLVWLGEESPQSYPLKVSNSPAAGAALLQTLPISQARDIPLNMRRALLRFDGDLADFEVAWELHDPSGSSAVEARRITCPTLGLGPGDCIWLTWSRELAPQTLYTLSLSGDLHDATGAAVTFPPLSFETATQADYSPPTPIASPCAKDEEQVSGACVLGMEDSFGVRVQSEEPALVEMLALPARTADLAAQDPVELELAGLTSEGPCRFLRLTDLAENRLEIPLCTPLPRDLATLTIDEVRADPLGPEPAQEYVELLNFGTLPLVMAGFFLTDDPFSEGRALSMPSPLLPGERVLVVGPDFERREPNDAPVPDAVRLLRLDASLSLANDGSSLFLRDAQGRRLAEIPRLAPAAPGLCVARAAGSRPRSGHSEAFVHDETTICTPGSASTPSTAVSTVPP
ncbi:MAG: hypothetical protein QM778_05380 [Myxococcales bacterium]